MDFSETTSYDRATLLSRRLRDYGRRAHELVRDFKLLKEQEWRFGSALFLALVVLATTFEFALLNKRHLEPLIVASSLTGVAAILLVVAQLIFMRIREISQEKKLLSDDLTYTVRVLENLVRSSSLIVDGFSEGRELPTSRDVEPKLNAIYGELEFDLFSAEAELRRAHFALTHSRGRFLP